MREEAFFAFQATPRDSQSCVTLPSALPATYELLPKRTRTLWENVAKPYPAGMGEIRTVVLRNSGRSYLQKNPF